MKGTNTILGGGGFHHLAMKVANFEAVVGFYKALGFVEKRAWGEGDKRAVMLDTGDGNYLEVFAGGTPPQEGGAVLHYALRVSDCDAATRVAREAGAVVTVEPKQVNIPSRPVETPVRLSFVKGLAGETIEFFQNETT